MKHEYKKHEKKYYCPKATPELVEIPKFNFICIDGKGNPNGADFGKRIEALYPVAYGIKMLPKKGIEIKDYFEYTVYPLEGIWTLSEVGIKEKQENNSLNKDELEYTIMIRQPAFITEEIFNTVVKTLEKKSIYLLNEVYFKSYEEGLAVQILHNGPYDTEEESFVKMRKYIAENNLEIVTLQHREIYLSDNRKTSPEKLKTILRYQVKKL